MASVDLLTKIIEHTKATCDQEHIPLLLNQACDTPDRTSYIVDPSAPSPLPSMRAGLKLLEQAGCEAFAIGCNTAHYFAKELCKDAKIPLLHMPALTVDWIKQQYIGKRVAIIATESTQKTGIYAALLAEAGIKECVLSQEQMQTCMDCIYKGAKAGKTAAYQEIFDSLIAELKEKQGAELFIAACTEIPLFMQNSPHKELFVDATEVLAKAIISFSRGC